MKHPYQHIPDAQRWSRAMAQRPLADIDPVAPPPFRLNAGAKLATAGSCFAQHLARHLRLRGWPPFDAEPAHPLLGDELAQQFGYGIYSARYGNIYTARQLLQLWRRATGAFVPDEDVWEEDGAFYDPFRPTIQPGGCPTRDEYAADRRQHFAAVRRAFGEADVLVFTLGLTECWAARSDGAVYPLCPGVAAGTFDPQRHAFMNFSVDEVVADLCAFLVEVRAVNPKLKLILTVSPVPLAATAEARHVWVSTVYSKSVLRVAADIVAREAGVYYFPAYEIVQAAGSAAFGPDRRAVGEVAVGRVMELFFRHVVDSVAEPIDAMSPAEVDPLAGSQAVVDAWCDESRLDPAPPTTELHT